MARSRPRVGYEIGNVAEAMTARVLTCPPETPLRAVAETMARHRVHSVVVHDANDEASWGVVSDLDLVAGALSGFDETIAGAAAATPVLTVAPDDTLVRAAQLMREHSTSHLLVVDREAGQPVGILSTLDLARAIAADPARTVSGGR